MRLLALIALIPAFLLAATPSTAPYADPSYEEMRKHLPDYSENTTGLLGPFIWSRALDLGEDARFSNADGRPDPKGDHLWVYQFNRSARKKGFTEFAHARNNFVAADPDLAFAVQPSYFLHNTPAPHNSKIVFGYVQNSLDNPAFLHGDNCDLAHLANGDRVVVFFPVRKDNNTDGNDQNNYYVNPHYAAQTPCVIEFKKHEMIHYEHFRPGNLAPRILFDLQPYFSGDKKLNPATSKPIIRFDIDGKGGWTLRIKRDGTRGIADLADDSAYDHVFTSSSPGARKYTVDVTNENSAWALSVFSPGGAPTDSSELLLRLLPFSRTTGKPVAFPPRAKRVHDVPLGGLGKAIGK